jgi:hypothetical protein
MRGSSGSDCMARAVYTQVVSWSTQSVAGWGLFDETIGASTPHLAVCTARITPRLDRF